jgi:glycine/D-amino acid oxidase-like deaminating enzyme
MILGGGTAGWMTACLLAQRWGGKRITLVESPDVGIIGVGEGSTPQLRAFFQTLGLAEADWMPRCNATYKNGIRFSGWSDRPGFESYYHPFVTALDAQTLPAFTYNTRARRTGRDVWAHPDRFFLPTTLSVQRLAPLPAENFPFDVSYGYHFDAHVVGQVLRDHAVGLGVTHLQRHVEGVSLTEKGDVQSLHLRDGDTLSAHFFLDCSGFGATIHQQALGVPFLSFADNLFNDSAVVMPTPSDPTGLNPHTTSTALSNGWAWHIPLTNRTGNGYVYASSFLSADQAETELRAHLGMRDDTTNARHLKMRVGRVTESWSKNCLAVGLSQGFIEPLEATALHIVQATVEQFMDAYEGGSQSTFNTDIAARYDGIRDYIVAHYRMNQRSDTDYWRANAENQNLSDALKAMMTAWFRAQDLDAVIAELGIGGYYSSLSWHCLFAGYGTFPPDARLVPPGDDITHYDMAQIDDFIRRCALNFSDHRTVLDTHA